MQCPWHHGTGKHTWFNDPSSRILDNNIAAIQMLEGKVEATQGLREANVVRAVQIIILAGEGVVLRLVEHNDHIPRLHARLLMALSTEGDLLAIAHPFVHMDLQDLRLWHCLLALTGFTPVPFIDHLTCKRRST